MLEDVKDRLLATDITQFQQFQGEAKAIKALLRVIDEPTFDELKARGVLS